MIDIYKDLVPVYRYYTANLITGKIVMEVPFQGVSWERKISAAGSFSGNIAADPNEDHFDLYDSTVPGKYGLYVMRDGVCVWGGIIWSREYDIVGRVLTVNALEFVSYLHHRVYWKGFSADTYEDSTTDKTVKEFLELLINHVNNDQNALNLISAERVNNDPYGYLASDVHKRVNNYQWSGSSITLTTEEEHDLKQNDTIIVGGFLEKGIDGVDSADNTPWTVTGVTSRQFTFTGGTSGTQPLTATPADAGTFVVKYSTASLLASNANVRITTDISNDLGSSAGYTDAYGDNNPFTFRGSEMRYVGEILQNFATNGVPVRNISAASVPNVNSLRVIAVQRIDGVATLTTFTNHSFSVGDVVTVSNIPTVIGSASYNGSGKTITAVTENTISYSNSGDNEPERSLYSTSVSSVVRFDYFVESSYDPETYTFNNVFRAWKVRQDVNDPEAATVPDLSELYGPSELGASQFVFEHPGNIVAMTLKEDSDASATRTWVVDSGNDLGGIALKYYGGYTNLTYLEEGYPILETAVTDKDYSVSSDEQMIPYAKRIGYRLAPPIGTYNVTVNGSLSPEVGTYLPGDWCVVVPNDAFIAYRLKPPYENRNNVLVRKIRSIRVSVPDFPAFPETVELELIPEWEVT